MGFISSLVGSKNNYHASPTTLNLTDYSGGIKTAMNDGLTPSNNLVDNTQSNQSRNQQQNLIQALTQQLQGNGPSLAQGQLQGATQANAAQGAGALASVKGMNPAMAARLIAEQTAGANQGAANQSAQVKIQEQQNAVNGLGDVLANTRGQDISQAQGSTAAGINTLNANTNRLGTVGGLSNTQNNSAIADNQGANQINADVSQQNAKTAGGIFGGIANAIGGAVAGPLGGLFGGGGSGDSGGTGSIEGEPMWGPTAPGSATGFGSAAHGAKIPGRANVPGDSPANDTVPTMLSPGEIVVPRTAAKDPEKAKAFVAAVKSHKAKMQSPEGYGKVLEAHRALTQRIQHLEKLCYGGMA